MTWPACPHVYRAINAITAQFSKDGIAKSHTNLKDQYQYRSIDDVLNRLGPLLAKHRLCILPRVLKHRTKQCVGEQDVLLVSVRLLAAFDLVSIRRGEMPDPKVYAGDIVVVDGNSVKALYRQILGTLPAVALFGPF